MRFTVGGRSLELEQGDVVRALRGVEPEPIRTHVVELQGTVYPPKQVLAVVTGWPRQSFTTMEAQRVLGRLGFTCRRAGRTPAGEAAWVAADSPATYEALREPSKTDLVIRDVPQHVAAVIDARAERLGISPSEYVRRQLTQSVTTAWETVTTEDLRRFSDTFADLADTAVMGDAWR